MTRGGTEFLLASTKSVGMNEIQLIWDLTTVRNGGVKKNVAIKFTFNSK
jgi:hypothetical protein